jgi:hypothetical protein
MTTEVETSQDLNPNISWKNLRRNQEIEGLYRFIDEHNLRREAKIIFEELWKLCNKKKRPRKSSGKRVT